MRRYWSWYAYQIRVKIHGSRSIMLRRVSSWLCIISDHTSENDTCPQYAIFMLLKEFPINIWTMKMMKWWKMNSLKSSSTVVHTNYVCSFKVRSRWIRTLNHSDRIFVPIRIVGTLLCFPRLSVRFVTFSMKAIKLPVRSIRFINRITISQSDNNE